MTELPFRLFHKSLIASKALLSNPCEILIVGGFARKRGDNRFATPKA